MEISEAAQEFKDALREHLPKNDLTAVSEGQSNLVVGSTLSDYFALAAVTRISIPWTAEWLKLYPLSELDSGQLGYRWSGKIGVPSRHWRSNWIVLGDWSGDPVIFDTETESVSMAEHGTGEWTPQVMTPDLVSFLRLLTVWIKVTIGEFEGEILDDDTCEILPGVRSRIEAELQFLDQPYRDNFVRGLAG